ncbi:methyltransferase [Parvibaculum sp.]|uniref:methyltransferase n=1 Tax=Parvibaculum sp. TaxID=2024848 RepID=UPI00320F6989
MQGVKIRTAKPKLPPAAIVNFLGQIRSGLVALTRKMVPPPVAVLEMLTGFWASQCISLIAKLGLADLMSEKEAISCRTLAEKSGSNADALYRVMRALSTVGIFAEDSIGHFRLTPMGATLRTDHPQSMRYFSIYQGSLNWDNWGALSHCVATGRNAIEHLHGMKSFEYISGDPARADIFDKGMVNVSEMELDPVLAAYDFSPFRTVADIGGGYGAVLGSILMLNPGMKGILFDLPHTAEGARRYFDEAGLGPRVETHGGSFFDSVPGGADAYVMKHIIHDWSDEESILIMKNIRAKIPATGKLLLIEHVIPAPGVAHFSKFLDLEMLVATTGRERTEPEYAALMAKAGFRLERIVPTIGLASVIEASPV